LQVQNFTSSRFNKFNILQVPDLTISRFNKVKILQVYKAQNFTSLQAYKLTSLQAYKFTSSHVKVSISCSPNDFVKMHNHIKQEAIQQVQPFKFLFLIFFIYLNDTKF
jgi:hypothetical protein